MASTDHPPSPSLGLAHLSLSERPEPTQQQEQRLQLSQHTPPDELVPRPARPLPSRPKRRPASPSSREATQGMLSLLDTLIQQADVPADVPALAAELSELAQLSDPLGPETSPSSVPAHRKRVETMRRVRDVLDQMWWSGSNDLADAAKLLADTCRNPDWRAPAGEARVLEFFCSVLVSELMSPDLLQHALRLIGNACAEIDENRERVVSQNYLPPILNLVDEDVLAKFAIPVIYNICIDYEPAQKQAAEQGLISVLIGLISRMSTIAPGDEAFFSYVYQLMELVVTSPGATSHSPENSVEILFRAALDLDVGSEDGLAVMNTAIAHFSDVRFQQILVEKNVLELPLSILVKSYSPSSSPEDATPDAEPPSEDEKLLSQMRNKLIEVLSDVSAMPDFSRHYPLDSPLVGSLRVWLTCSQSQLQVCACIMLGNLARSDQVCSTMVHDFQLYEPLVNILRESNDTQVLHAATGFLKNLALLPSNKDALGANGIIEVVSRLWSMETSPQSQFGGVSLARQVVSGSYANILRLLEPLSPDPDSPAHSRTYLSLLLLLCAKTDQAPIKTEIARTITAVFRVLNSAQVDVSPEVLEELQQRIYRLHPTIGRPLAEMTCQTKWPVVRSEGWFAFALMARSKEGASAVSNLFSSTAVLRSLVQTVNPRETPKAESGEQPPEWAPEWDDQGDSEVLPEEQRKLMEMRRIDRENALVLITKILENMGDDIGSVARQIFEDLLKGKEIPALSFPQSSESGDDDDRDEEARAAEPEGV